MGCCVLHIVHPSKPSYTTSKQPSSNVENWVSWTVPQHSLVLEIGCGMFDHYVPTGSLNVPMTPTTWGYNFAKGEKVLLCKEQNNAWSTSPVSIFRTSMVYRVRSRVSNSNFFYQCLQGSCNLNFWIYRSESEAPYQVEGKSSIGQLPVATYRATDAILNSKFGQFFKKGVLDLILIVEMF